MQTSSFLCALRVFVVKHLLCWPCTASFLLVFTLTAVPHLKLTNLVPLLAERYVPGTGWIEIVLASLYAAWLTRIVVSTRKPGRVRQRIWIMFSVVFFLQVIAGLCGVEKMLMTGELHLPVPALIVAGPVYRGHGFFMPILFLATVIIAGPAWCSWLCYVGAWDSLAAQARKSHPAPPRFRTTARLILLVGIIVVALVLRLTGSDTPTAVLTGAGFGIAGVAIMLTLSRKRGVMIHCTMYCPIGLLSTVLGKINPFRLRIGTGCTDCGVCTGSCRYGALESHDILRRKPGITCTLCGDCTVVCPHGQIGFRFPWLGHETARKVFLVIVVSLHAVFLVFARL